MNVTCPGCTATLTIPDDGLPKGKAVTAACPRCKGPITIDRTADAPPPEPAATPPVPAAVETEEYPEQGRLRALVCVHTPAERQQVVTSLKRIGYAPHSAKDSGEAIERLRISSCDIVVLTDGFDPPGQDGPSIRACLADMGMTGRRNVHVVLIDPGQASNDPRAAFARSVDLVLHPNDIPHFEEALGRSKAETEVRYRVLKECLQAMGKA